jgi:hypothetical protein
MRLLYSYVILRKPAVRILTAGKWLEGNSISIFCIESEERLVSIRGSLWNSQINKKYSGNALFQSVSALCHVQKANERLNKSDHKICSGES